MQRCPCDSSTALVFIHFHSVANNRLVYQVHPFYALDQLPVLVDLPALRSRLADDTLSANEGTPCRNRPCLVDYRSISITHLSCCTVRHGL